MVFFTLYSNNFSVSLGFWTPKLELGNNFAMGYHFSIPRIYSSMVEVQHNSPNWINKCVNLTGRFKHGWKRHNSFFGIDEFPSGVINSEVSA